MTSDCGNEWGPREEITGTMSRAHSGNDRRLVGAACSTYRSNPFKLDQTHRHPSTGDSYSSGPDYGIPLQPLRRELRPAALKKVRGSCGCRRKVLQVTDTNRQG